jgi:hypothetical protein
MQTTGKPIDIDPFLTPTMIVFVAQFEVLNSWICSSTLEKLPWGDARRIDWWAAAVCAGDAAPRGAE